MLLVFFRHGSVAALVAGVAAVLLLWLFGVIALEPLLILLGALLFYLSEIHCFSSELRIAAGKDKPHFFVEAEH